MQQTAAQATELEAGQQKIRLTAEAKERYTAGNGSAPTWTLSEEEFVGRIAANFGQGRKGLYNGSLIVPVAPTTGFLKRENAKTGERKKATSVEVVLWSKGLLIAKDGPNAIPTGEPPCDYYVVAVHYW